MHLPPTLDHLGLDFPGSLLARILTGPENCIIYNSKNGLFDWMLAAMLADEILEDYIKIFFGYGDLKAKIWFVGMEEGGEHDSASFNLVLRRWAEAGKPGVIDIAPTETAANRRYFYTEKPAIVKTWGKLIRATLHALNEEVSNDKIRAYQANRLARPNGETCLLELMPLWSKDTASWPYGEISNLSYLKSRQDYMNHVAPARETALAALIKGHRPKVVVFYSKGYFKRWQNVVGTDVAWSPQQPFGKVASVDGPVFYCVPHPTAFGTTNALFDELGEDMKRALRTGEPST
jgi:hypothetical protein